MDKANKAKMKPSQGKATPDFESPRKIVHARRRLKSEKRSGAATADNSDEEADRHEPGILTLTTSTTAEGTYTSESSKSHSGKKQQSSTSSKSSMRMIPPDSSKGRSHRNGLHTISSRDPEPFGASVDPTRRKDAPPPPPPPPPPRPREEFGNHDDRTLTSLLDSMEKQPIELSDNLESPHSLRTRPAFNPTQALLNSIVSKSFTRKADQVEEDKTNTDGDANADASSKISFGFGSLVGNEETPRANMGGSAQPAELMQICSFGSITTTSTMMRGENAPFPTINSEGCHSSNEPHAVCNELRNSRPAEAGEGEISIREIQIPVLATRATNRSDQLAGPLSKTYNGRQRHAEEEIRALATKCAANAQDPPEGRDYKSGERGVARPDPPEERTLKALSSEEQEKFCAVSVESSGSWSSNDGVVGSLHGGYVGSLKTNNGHSPQSNSPKQDSSAPAKPSLEIPVTTPRTNTAHPTMSSPTPMASNDCRTSKLVDTPKTSNAYPHPNIPRNTGNIQLDTRTPKANNLRPGGTLPQEEDKAHLLEVRSLSTSHSELDRELERDGMNEPIQQDLCIKALQNTAANAAQSTRCKGLKKLPGMLDSGTAKYPGDQFSDNAIEPVNKQNRGTNGVDGQQDLDVSIGQSASSLETLDSDESEVFPSPWQLISCFLLCGEPLGATQPNSTGRRSRRRSAPSGGRSHHDDDANVVKRKSSKNLQSVRFSVEEKRVTDKTSKAQEESASVIDDVSAIESMTVDDTTVSGRDTYHSATESLVDDLSWVSLKERLSTAQEELKKHAASANYVGNAIASVASIGLYTMEQARQYRSFAEGQKHQPVRSRGKGSNNGKYAQEVPLEITAQGEPADGMELELGTLTLSGTFSLERCPSGTCTSDDETHTSRQARKVLAKAAGDAPADFSQLVRSSSSSSSFKRSSEMVSIAGRNGTQPSRESEQEKLHWVSTDKQSIEKCTVSTNPTTFGSADSKPHKAMAESSTMVTNEGAVSNSARKSEAVDCGMDDNSFELLAFKMLNLLPYMENQLRSYSQEDDTREIAKLMPPEIRAKFIQAVRSRASALPEGQHGLTSKLIRDCQKSGFGEEGPSNPILAYLNLSDYHYQNGGTEKNELARKEEDDMPPSQKSLCGVIDDRQQKHDAGKKEAGTSAKKAVDKSSMSLPPPMPKQSAPPGSESQLEGIKASAETEVPAKGEEANKMGVKCRTTYTSPSRLGKSVSVTNNEPGEANELISRLSCDVDSIMSSPASPSFSNLDELLSSPLDGELLSPQSERQIGNRPSFGTCATANSTVYTGDSSVGCDTSTMSKMSFSGVQNDGKSRSTVPRKPPPPTIQEGGQLIDSAEHLLRLKQDDLSPLKKQEKRPGPLSIPELSIAESDLAECELMSHLSGDEPSRFDSSPHHHTSDKSSNYSGNEKLSSSTSRRRASRKPGFKTVNEEEEISLRESFASVARPAKSSSSSSNYSPTFSSIQLSFDPSFDSLGSMVREVEEMLGKKNGEPFNSKSDSKSDSGYLQQTLPESERKDLADSFSDSFKPQEKAPLPPVKQLYSNQHTPDSLEVHPQ